MFATNPTPLTENIDIYSSPPNLDEVQNAIKSLKNKQAMGINAIYAELLKSDVNTSSKVFHGLFKNIREKESIPTAWAKRLIVKIPQKRTCTTMTSEEEFFFTEDPKQTIS